ncbi:MAG: response regulator [Planctomycetia bacterium]|nr:response regulator [Planctomycetia bacterium]
MVCITIVDDSPLDLMLIAGLLKTNPEYHVGFAKNGRDAMEKITGAPPHLVITDLIMPEMDGFELVREMDKRFPDIPVILMTAYGNESIAVRALEAGAASYVPKAQQAERLLETVERVLARADTEHKRVRVAECVTEFHCTFALDNDPELIPPLIDDIQQRLAGICIDQANERVRTAVALEEALLNAMHHGNLEITPEEVAEARSRPLSGRMNWLIDERRKRGEYRKRKIRLEAHITTQGARFVIRDEGSGFDLSAKSIVTDSECFETGKQRGMMLMRSLMDEISYNDAGNEVTLFKRAKRRTSHERQ